VNTFKLLDEAHQFLNLLLFEVKESWAFAEEIRNEESERTVQFFIRSCSDKIIALTSFLIILCSFMWLLWSLVIEIFKISEHRKGSFFFLLGC